MPLTSIYGDNVAITATPSTIGPGGAPSGGSVAFSLDSATTAFATSPLDGTGKASASISNIPASTTAGTRSTRFYQGDANHAASADATQSITVSARGTTTTVSTDHTSGAVFGESVTFTAGVSYTDSAPPTPTKPVGSFQFFDDQSATPATAFATVPLYRSSAAVPGHDGDGGAQRRVSYDYGEVRSERMPTSAGSQNTVPQGVSKADTTATLTSGTNPSIVGQPVVRSPRP